MAYPVAESSDCPSLIYSSNSAANVSLNQEGKVEGWNFARSSTSTQRLALASTSINTIRHAGHVSSSQSNINLSEKAALRQNLRWFRKELPHVDVPSSLLKSEIRESFDINNLQYEGKHLIGNRLCVNGSKIRKRATNETAFYVTDSSPRALQMCELRRDREDVVETQRNFPSNIIMPMPILGLYKSKADFTTALPPLLALRSQYSTSIMLPYFVDDHPEDTSTALIDTVTDIGDDFGGHQHHDITLNDWKGGKEAAIINERGEVVIWTCVANQFGGRRTFYADSLEEWNMRVINRVDIDNVNTQPKWQVNYTANDNLLIKSASDITVLDLRTFDLAQKFHYAQDPSLSPSKSRLWSVASATDHDIFVAMSDSIAWIDHRFASRPVLSWNHHLRPDPSIGIELLKHDNDSFETIIWSLSSSLVTAYSFDRSGDPPQYSSGLDPYAINTAAGQLDGLSFNPSIKGFDFFTSTTDGRLSHQNLIRTSEQKWPLTSDPPSDDFVSVEEQSSTTKEFRKVDFSKIVEESLKEADGVDGGRDGFRNLSLVSQVVSPSLPSMFGFPFDGGTTPDQISSRLKDIYLGVPAAEIDDIAERLALQIVAKVEDIPQQEDNASSRPTALDHFDTQISLNDAAISIRDLWSTDRDQANDVIDFAKLFGDEVEAEHPKKRSRHVEAMPASDPAPSYPLETGFSRDHEPVDMFAASQPVAGPHATRSKTKQKKKATRTAGF